MSFGNNHGASPPPPGQQIGSFHFPFQAHGSGAGTLGFPLEGTRRVGGLLGVAARLSGTVSPFRAEQGTSLETPSWARASSCHRIKGAKYSFALQDGTWEFSGDALAGKGLIM